MVGNGNLVVVQVVVQIEYLFVVFEVERVLMVFHIVQLKVSEEVPL